MSGLVEGKPSAAHELRAALKKIDGIDPDDVIMSPDRRKVTRTDADSLLSGRQPCAGRVGDKEHCH